ncbi:cytochrome P450 CYP12A2 [Plutella xylostella]|uniref:cytochrome P450 CYP12A2 n=1 Tax=Plutella xylostella TaxID=51655 RepID=UPI002032DBB0|nr:cytochrome P450 CYP12A2 [Plutella xylostella]
MQLTKVTNMKIKPLQKIWPAAQTLAGRRHQATDARPYKEVPGPPSWPVIGPLLEFIPGGSIGDMTLDPKVFRLLNEKFGDIVRVDPILTKPGMCFLFDPEAISQVLRGESVYPVRPGFDSLTYYRKKYMKTDITGLITEHGEKWKTIRSKVNPVLLHPKIMKLYEPVIDEVAQDMIKRIRSLRDSDLMIREGLDYELNKWGLESISTVALGGRLGALDPDLPEDSPVAQLIQCVHDVLEVLQEMDFNKPGMWKYIPTKQFREAMKLYDQQMQLSKYFVMRAVKDIERNRNVNSNEKSVLEKLLEIDEDIAVVMASDMLFGGVDASAHTVLAIMHLLATNPEKQTKLREEVLKNGDRKYLKACIKEGMRLKPIAVGNGRDTSKEYILHGYRIPKKTRVIFAHLAISMKETQYPRPNDFIPERWLTTKEDPLFHGHAHPFATMPFGFGARQCIGKPIAMIELEAIISRLVQNFEIGWQGPQPAFKLVALNYFVGPFGFVFKDV